MKRVIFYSVMALLLVSYGCQKDSEVNYYPATALSLSTTKVSELDANFVAELSSTRPDVTEVKVTLNDGTVLATVSVSDGNGSVSIPTTALGLSAAGESVVVRLVAVYDGQEIQDRATISMYSPFSVTLPSILEEGTMVEKYVYFSTTTSSSTVSSIALTRKIGLNGTAYVYPNTFDVASDSIGVVPSDYALGDTLFFELSAVSGTITSKKSFSLIVKKNLFPAAMSINLNHAKDSIYNLLDGSLVNKDSVEISDLVYQSLAPGTVGFKSLSAMEFVKITGFSFDDPNFITAKNLYDAGTPVFSVASVASGDMYAFKVTRPIEEGGDPVTFYGVISVVSTHITIDNGVETSSIDMDYAVKELY